MLFNSVHDSPQLQSGVEVDASQWNLERMVECSGQPSLTTIFSTTYRYHHPQICSILFQFHNPGSSECASFLEWFSFAVPRPGQHWNFTQKLCGDDGL